MTKSKFSFWTYIIILLIIVLPIITVNLYINRIDAFGENYQYKIIFVAGLLIFSLAWLTFGILRRRILKLIIEKNSITVNNLIGTKNYNFDDFNGYYTLIERSRAGDFEVMILSRKDGKKIIVSEFIFSNYSALKKSLVDNLKSLGQKPYSYIQDLKDTFS